MSAQYSPPFPWNAYFDGYRYPSPSNQQVQSHVTTPLDHPSTESFEMAPTETGDNMYPSHAAYSRINSTNSGGPFDTSPYSESSSMAQLRPPMSSNVMIYSNHTAINSSYSIAMMTANHHRQEETPDTRPQQIEHWQSDFTSQHELPPQPSSLEGSSSNPREEICQHPNVVTTSIPVIDDQPPLPKALGQTLPARGISTKLNSSQKLSAEIFLEFKQLLKKETWFVNNEPEPPITGTDVFVQRRWCQQTDCSRFMALATYHEDNRYHCGIPHNNENDGRPCNASWREKRDAVAHACRELDYTPYSCGGRCGKKDCETKFTINQRRKDHWRNKDKIEKEAKVGCRHCKVRPMLIRNFRRHHQDKCRQARQHRCKSFELCMVPASQSSS